MVVLPFMISALTSRSIDRIKANELMMLGDPVDADEAVRMGFVNVVVTPRSSSPRCAAGPGGSRPSRRC